MLHRLKEIGEAAKPLAETGALVCAAIYFGYKTLVGYFYIDLCLSISSSRTASTTESDTLVIIATLKKGSRGSVCIHDLQARVTCNGSAQLIPFVGFHRLSYVTAPIRSVDRKAISWSLSESAPLLRIPPDEQAQFSCYTHVPKDAICVVEVAVLGRELKWRRVAQWRASHVSAPEKKTA